MMFVLQQTIDSILMNNIILLFIYDMIQASCISAILYISDDLLIYF